MPWFLLIQITLLGLWYTVAPELPAWLVFLPTALAAVYGTVAVVILLVAVAANK